MTPYRRASLWAPATRRRDSRLCATLLLGPIVLGVAAMWLAASPQPSRRATADELVRHLAFQRYTEWHAEYPAQHCPHRLGDLGGAVLDPWGRAMHYTCDRRLMHDRADIVVMSAGEDGVFGTGDDIRSSP